MLVLLAKCTTFYKFIKRNKTLLYGGTRVEKEFGVTTFVVFSTICTGRNQNIGMSSSIRRDIIFTKYRGWISLRMVVMLQRMSLTDLSVQR